MAAVYPSSIKSFGAPVKDAETTVYAAHVNDLRDEVGAVESELGTGLKSSTWTGAFAQSASWATLAQRLTNIERGIVTTSDVHTQYVKKAGDAMTGALDMGGTKITGLQAGESTNDVVNYGQVILRSGVNAMSANLNMGTTYKITNLANGSVSTDALAYGQVLASGTTLISGLFSATNPVMDGTAAVGTSAQPARSDHVHPSDTSKLSTSGGTMTGYIYGLQPGNNVAMGGNKITGLAAASANGDAVRFEQPLMKTGGTMTGYIYGLQPGNNVAMGGNKITGLAAASANGDAVRFEQPLMKTGGTMSGAIAMGSQKITGLAKGTATGDAVARQQIQTGTTPPFTGPAYATITFSPAFASPPVVVITSTTDVSAEVYAGSWWVANVSNSSARLYNAIWSAVGFNWIAVGD